MEARRSLRDLPDGVTGDRRALVRVDYNVPLDGARVADAGRIDASLPTLRMLLERGSRPVLLSHLGRPRGEVRPELSLRPVAAALADRIEAEVLFVPDTAGEDALDASRALRPGAILLLENTRFLPGETANDPDLARRLARLGDYFVSDAFGSLHRAHASTVGVPTLLRPAVAGLLVEREIEALGALRSDPPRPFVVGFGGAKISDKIELLEAFLDRADRILVGGAMANTFLRAQGRETGRSLVEEEALELAASILARAGDRLRLPRDVMVTADPSDSTAAPEAVPVDAIPASAAAMDIGPDTRRDFAETIVSSRAFFWNGPMGLFEDERFATGTFAVARAAAEATRAGAFTVIGGGDSAAAIRAAGLAEAVTHVSTGGGAALEYLSRGTLPGIEVLDPPIPAAAEGRMA